MELMIDGQRKRAAFTGTLGSLLKKLKIMREEVVVKVNGRLAPETREIGPKDKVEVVKVVFGG